MEIQKQFSAKPSGKYETQLMLNEYLLFHYGSDQDQMPFSFGPLNSINFPVRCVSDCVDIKRLARTAKALELGCAVGRSSFELARYCAHVTAIDTSHTFIKAAQHIQQFGHLEYSITQEGGFTETRTAKPPVDASKNNISFICGNVMEMKEFETKYDLVLSANVLCRVPDPENFLKIFHKLVQPDGQLILISPYSWLEEYTVKSHWLGKTATGFRKNVIDAIHEILNPHFNLQRTLDIPFVLRDHLRKYEWGVSQASMWLRK